MNLRHEPDSSRIGTRRTMTTRLRSAARATGGKPGYSRPDRTRHEAFFVVTSRIPVTTGTTKVSSVATAFQDPFVARRRRPSRRVVCEANSSEPMQADPIAQSYKRRRDSAGATQSYSSPQGFEAHVRESRSGDGSVLAIVEAATESHEVLLMSFGGTRVVHRSPGATRPVDKAGSSLLHSLG